MSLTAPAAHEALVRFEQRGYAYSFGWLQSLTIDESPVFEPGVQLEFAKTTIVNGANASGKTALCEWLAGCAEISFLKRWATHGRRQSRTQVRFSAVNPLPLTWTIRIFDESNIQFDVNGTSVPRLSLPRRFVYVPAQPSKLTDETIAEYLARWFRVDQSLIRNTVKSLAAHGGHHVNNPRFMQADDDREELLVDVDGTVPNLSFGALSGSEQRRVALELAIELARHEATHSPTMLMIEVIILLANPTAPN